MLYVDLDHPSEDVLERYSFRNSSWEEIEVIEGHILGCNDCIARLEDIESYAAVFRAASEELSLEESLRPERQVARRGAWFTPGRLAWASAGAMLFIAISFIPVSIPRRHEAIPLRVNVSAWRGVDIASVATGHPLDLRLNSTDLHAGAVVVQLVDSSGREVWHGPASVRNESVAVSLPTLNRRDNYFVRLYSVGSNGATYGDLLREFGLRAK
jgi:hypothetical protein